MANTAKLTGIVLRNRLRTHAERFRFAFDDPARRNCKLERCLVAAAGFFRSVSLHTADIVQTRDAGRETDTRSHSVCRHRKRGTTISHANCWHALLSNKTPCKSRRSALLLCRRRQRRQHHTARALESETTTPRQRRQAQLQHSVAPRPDSVRAILAGLRVQQMTPALCL